MKINWIECGLPWNVNNYSEIYNFAIVNCPKYNPPGLKKETKSKFGKTEDEAYKEYLDAPYTGSEDNKALKKYRKFTDKFNKWEEEYNKLPNIKKYIEKYNKLYNEYLEKKKIFEEEINQNSFSGRGLNKAGTLIETEDGKQYLIGHINELSGICDDCREFENSTIIKRYAIVYILTQETPQ
jgi:hypothetical protein